MAARSISQTTFNKVLRPRLWGLWELIALYRSRRALARLDNRALEDVGLTEFTARLEADRPVWDVPQNWRL